MTDLGAARFVERFADGWSGPHAERWLVQPLFGATDGRDAADSGFMQPLFRFLPDLRLAVTRWSAAGDVVFIEWTASATLAGRPLRWSGVDRCLLADGRARERVAYFDALPLFLTVLRCPSSWPAFVRSGMLRSWRRLLS